MSLKSETIPAVPEDTTRVARAAFPHGNPYLTLRDTLGRIFQDPFIVYTSNVFAILGLRALYFLLAGVIHRFHYLQLGLAVVLVFVGTKMLLTDVYKIPVGLALGVVAVVLGAAVVASLLFPRRAAAHDPVIHDPLAPKPDPAVAPIGPHAAGTGDVGHSRWRCRRCSLHSDLMSRKFFVPQQQLEKLTHHRHFARLSRI